MDIMQIAGFALMALLFVPLTGLIVGGFIMMASTLIQKLFEQGEVWREQFGEFKSNYAVWFIIGSVVILLAWLLAQNR
jgi:ABC-type enterochelin transport system permease subunit